MMIRQWCGQKSVDWQNFAFNRARVDNDVATLLVVYYNVTYFLCNADPAASSVEYLVKGGR